VGWWPFIGDTKLWRDFNLGHNMSPASTGTISVDRVSDFGHGGLFSDSVTQRFVVNDGLGFSDFPITFGGWARPDLGSNMHWFWCGDVDSSGGNSSIGITSLTNIRAFFNTSVHDTTVPAIDTTKPSLFIFVAETVTNRRTYFNGKLVETFTSSVSFPTIEDFGLGALGDLTPGNPWSGGVFEAFVWNRALTDTEIYALYDPATRWDLYEQPQSRSFIDLTPTPFANPAIITTKKVPTRPTFGLPRLNRESPQAEGLVGWWPFSNNVGVSDIKDASGNGHDAEPQASILVSNWTPVSGHGWTMDFEGVSTDRYSIPTLPDLPANESATLSAWVVVDSGTVNQGIISWGQTGNNPIITMGINANDRLIWFIETDTGAQVSASDSGATVPLGEAIHIAVVFDRASTNTGRKFVNGRLVASEDISSAGTDQISTNGFGSLGFLHTAGTAFNGRLWDATIYHKALTDTEIYALYNPATRWDLYAQEPRRSYIDIPAALGTTIEIPSIGTPP
jgi:hypothetical protein